MRFQFLHTVCRHHHLPTVIRRDPALRVGRRIGSDLNEFTGNLRRRPLVEGRKGDFHRQSGPHLVDQRRRHLDIDAQRLVFRHHLHQGRSSSEYATDGVYAQPDDHPLRRGAHFGIGQFEGQSLEPTIEGSGLLLRLGETILDLLVVLLLARQHAHPDLADRLLRAAEIAEILGDGTAQLRQQALLLGQAIARQIAFGGQLAQALEFIEQQFRLLFLRPASGLEALDGGLQACQRVLHGRQFGLQAGAPGTQQLRLYGHRARRPRIVTLPQQILRKDDLRTTLDIGQQPRLGRLDDQPLATCHFVLRARHRRVKAQQNVATSDLIAVLDQDRLHHSRGKVLHGLAVTGHDHLAAGRHTLVKRCKTCPQQEATKAESDHQPAQPGSPAVIDIDRRPGRAHALRCHVRHVGDVASAALLSLEDVDRHPEVPCVRCRAQVTWERHRPTSPTMPGGPPCPAGRQAPHCPRASPPAPGRAGRAPSPSLRA